MEKAKKANPFVDLIRNPEKIRCETAFSKSKNFEKLLDQVNFSKGEVVKIPNQPREITLIYIKKGCPWADVDTMKYAS